MSKQYGWHTRRGAQFEYLRDGLRLAQLIEICLGMDRQQFAVRDWTVHALDETAESLAELSPQESKRAAVFACVKRMQVFKPEGANVIVARVDDFEMGSISHDAPPGSIRRRANRPAD
ncbi:MAG: hypothetical protein GC162_13030 [Planctomycetes bacterium]|nr:hypothetical protein [Planctomycetota bacterium]